MAKKSGKQSWGRVILPLFLRRIIMSVFDNISPPGSWRREWDARSHSEQEYREKINELRQRNKDYVEQIKELNIVIENLKEELVLVHKHIYGGYNRDQND